MTETNNNPSTTKIVECDVDKLSDDKEQLLQQVTEILGATIELGRRGTHCFYRLGYALAKLKLLHFKKCAICIERNSILFDVLSCERCAKMKGSSSKAFIDIAMKATGYKREYINFLIRAASLYTKFPKLKLTQWNCADLKKYMAYLRAKIEVEIDFWI